MAPGSAFLGFAAQALAELGFDMAGIYPETSATDHDPLARRGRLHSAFPGSYRICACGGLRLQVYRDDAVHELSPAWYEPADHIFNPIFDYCL